MHSNGHGFAWQGSRRRLLGLGTITSESFLLAKPLIESYRSTREDTDEKTIRFQQGPSRSGRAADSRQDKNHDSARQRRYRAFSGHGRSGWGWQLSDAH